MIGSIVIACFVVSMIFGIIGANIAESKGKPNTGFALGFFLWIFGVLIAAVMEPSRDYGKISCPNCGHLIPEGAKVCSYCEHRFIANASNSSEEKQCPKCFKAVPSRAIACPYCKYDLQEKQCPNCGKTVPNKAIACPFCKQDLEELTCPSCHKNLPPGSIICPFCKHDLEE